MIETVIDFMLKEAWASVMDFHGQTDSHVDVEISSFCSIEPHVKFSRLVSERKDRFTGKYV